METKELNKVVVMYKKPALEKQGNQEHIMALAVDKSSTEEGFSGLARIITKREGDVDIAGYIDRSQLFLVKSNDGLKWNQIKKLEIEGIEKIIEKYKKENSEFIGLEDPDIWTDENDKKHVYFTIPFIDYGLFLGHAEGKTLENLIATEPVLCPRFDIGISGFKELAMSPIKYKGKRINLTEAGADTSIITAVEAKDMGSKWKYLKVALHPFNTKYGWCAEHLSPCTFLPKEFIDAGNLLVGIVNGREKSKKEDEKTIYNKFRPGLILYNYKTGNIPWISPEPLFEDPDAATITFASDFMIKNKNEGILFAHVDDSFVRAYRIDSKALKEFLPKI